MKTIDQSFKRNAIAVAVSAALLAPAVGVQAAKSTNAQSLSFTLSSPQNFILSSEQFWAYNTADARTYFTNTVASEPTVACTGGGPGGVNCLAANRPSTPAAPEPLPNRLNAPVNNNQCVFWNGGHLSVQTSNSTYKQDLTLKGINGNGNWKFEWIYQVAVGDVNPVDEQVAWILESETPAEGVPIAVSGSLASQSTQNQTGKNARFKTSHTLLDGFGAARLTDAGIRLTKVGDPNVDLGTVELGLPGFPNYSVQQNMNFYYETNAGTFNQPPGLLVLNGWVDDIQQGRELATDGTTVDNFAGNDNSGGDRIVFGEDDPENGAALHLGDIDEEGTYKVTLFGKLKGNPGEIDDGFEGSADIKVNSACVAP